jgi:4-hydroxymandelate oxidase
MGQWAEELRRRAEEVLPEAVARYVAQGADEEVTAAEAVAAWRSYRVRGRVLRDVSSVDVSTTAFGSAVRAPIVIAPTTLQRQAHERGEAAMAEGAAAAGALLCVSSNAGLPFAAVNDGLAAGAAAGPAAGLDLSGPSGRPPGWWVQVYVQRDRGRTAELLARAVEAGATAVVVTVDTPVVAAKREGQVSVWDLVPDDHLHANEPIGPGGHREVEKAMDLAPDDIGWLASTAGLPVIVKGVLHPADARLAVAAGARGVWVSAHGGRQLDRSLASAHALREVASAAHEAAVGPRAAPPATVLVDGGLRSGLDIVVALALGADLVAVGRPAFWALAADGPAGVVRLVAELSDELTEAMRLAGARSIAEIPALDLLAEGWASSP